MKVFELYWKDIHIGSVNETNWDMRSSGDIVYHFDFQNNGTSLGSFIKHSIKASDYMDEGDEENYNKMCDEESKFLDIINSPDWFIKDKHGERTKILCPMFHDNNETTWQTDLS
jgi:hypothetical protein